MVLQWMCQRLIFFTKKLKLIQSLDNDGCSGHFINIHKKKKITGDDRGR